MAEHDTLQEQLDKEQLGGGGSAGTQECALADRSGLQAAGDNAGGAACSPAPGAASTSSQGGDASHNYLSTACLHGLHDRCRENCKFCAAPCRCECHSVQPAPEDSKARAEEIERLPKLDIARYQDDGELFVLPGLLEGRDTDLDGRKFEITRYVPAEQVGDSEDDWQYTEEPARGGLHIGPMRREELLARWKALPRIDREEFMRDVRGEPVGDEVSITLTDDEKKALRHEFSEPYGHDIRIGILGKLRAALSEGERDA